MVSAAFGEEIASFAVTRTAGLLYGSLIGANPCWLKGPRG